VHAKEYKDKKYTKRELVDMTTQDIGYLTSKRQAEKTVPISLQSTNNEPEIIENRATPILAALPG